MSDFTVMPNVPGSKNQNKIRNMGTLISSVNTWKCSSKYPLWYFYRIFRKRIRDLVPD
jgi:hypothetical protein